MYYIYKCCDCVCKSQVHAVFTIANSPWCIIAWDVAVITCNHLAGQSTMLSEFSKPNTHVLHFTYYKTYKDKKDRETKGYH